MLNDPPLTYPVSVNDAVVGPLVVSLLAFNLVGEGLNDALLPASGRNVIVKEEVRNE
jgi:hypothetical protein